MISMLAKNWKSLEMCCWQEEGECYTFRLFRLIQNSGVSGIKKSTAIKMAGIMSWTLAWFKQFKWPPRKYAIIVPKLHAGSNNEFKAPRMLEMCLFCLFVCHKLNMIRYLLIKWDTIYEDWNRNNSSTAHKSAQQSRNIQKVHIFCPNDQ